MAGLDILNVEKNKVSLDLSSYSTLVYGAPKIGKSTFVQDLYGSDVLFIGTENRFKSIEDAQVVQVSSWADMLKVKRQLKSDEAKALYKTIAIDTIGNAYDFLVKFVCAKYDEEVLGESGSFGKDYAEVKKLWADYFREIEGFGYTLVLVAHSITKIERVPKASFAHDGVTDVTAVKNKAGEFVEYERYVPDLNAKALASVNRSVDNILYLGVMVGADGVEKRVINLRDTLSWHAGSTFKDISPTIDLSASAYKDAVKTALKAYDKAKTTTKKSKLKDTQLDLDILKEEAKTLAKELVQAKGKETLDKLVEKNFGKGARLLDATDNQVELVASTIEAIKQLLAK